MNIWFCVKRASVTTLKIAAVSFAILIQLLVVSLVCALLPNTIADQVVGPILLTAPVLIGAGSYFIYERIVGQRTIGAVAERWLEERTHRSPKRRERILIATQIGPWIPTIFVGVVFLFLPESVGLATHVLHPGAVKLVAYRVSFPASWIITGASENESQTWAFAGALDCKGPLRSGFRHFWPLNLRASAVSVVTPSPANTIYPRESTLLSTRSVLLGGEPGICKEYSHDYSEWDTKDLRIVECSVGRNVISVSFFGDRSNLAEFFSSLKYIQRTR